VNRTIALFAFLIPSWGFCQSLAYMDANTPSEALGMMKSSMQMAQVLRQHCVERFPDAQEGIDADLLKWQQAESKVLEKVDFYWAEVLKKDPRAGQFSEQVETIVKKQLDMLANLQTPDGKAGAVVAVQYCRQHFADLASGIWRTRTPKTYAFMDRAPSPPVQNK
jgi:hypothetical protein